LAKKNAFIEVRIRELTQLFNSFDPSPFQERDLDSDAEEYIVAGRVNFLGTHRFELSCIFRKKKPAKHGSAAQR